MFLSTLLVCFTIFINFVENHNLRHIMANYPLISIITITYNAAGVIKPTMESIAAQGFRDFEHLIIDGASGDDTLRIAREVGGRISGFSANPTTAFMMQ